MASVALIVCALVLWAACAGVYVLGREEWPPEMPEAVRFATAPAIAAAATLAHKIVAPDYGVLARAAAFTLVVAALDAVALAPLLGGDRALLRSPVGFWLALAAIFAGSAATGAYGPM